MKADRWRGDVFEVAEHAPRPEPLEDLAVQRELACVVKVVDRKAGDHGVETAEIGQPVGEIMPHEAHARLIGESIASRRQHRLGKVEAHTEAVGSVAPQQPQQPSIAGTQVEDPSGVARDMIEQDALTLGAVRKRVGPGEVAQRVLRVLPLARRPLHHHDIMHVPPAAAARRPARAS